MNSRETFGANLSQQMNLMRLQRKQEAIDFTLNLVRIKLLRILYTNHMNLEDFSLSESII